MPVHKANLSPLELATTSVAATSTKYGYCLWEFTNEQWLLKKVHSQRGGVPGRPPLAKGTFEGQLRATPCIAPDQPLQAEGLA